MRQAPSPTWPLSLHSGKDYWHDARRRVRCQLQCYGRPARLRSRPNATEISDVKRREYEELKTFFVHCVTRILRLPIPLDHPAHPVNSITALESICGISCALVGLKQAVNDIIENCEDPSPSEISLADASLASAGSITLTEAIRRRSKLYKASLKRGTIRNETEFHVVSALRSDTALNLPESEFPFSIR